MLCITFVYAAMHPVMRTSCRENRSYSSFEDFLADLKQSKRKSIRQVRANILRSSKAPGAGGSRAWLLGSEAAMI
jgi:predicted N-acyltransferase